MEREWRVVIPKQDNARRPIRIDILRGFVREWAEHFGGATVLPRADGCWLMQQVYAGAPAGAPDRLHCEPTVILEGVRSGADPTEIRADGQWVAGFAERVGRDLGQEAVFEQQELATRTEFRPGTPLDRLPDDRIQMGPPPDDPISRMLSTG